ncbi:yeats2, putative [Pediculus humanus corporis]|uniref:Yeats2, putative n=1 Tax=Pediculus humanus subsp. corporis TaxID=121224 RepID=E0VHF2_PEDHC|nr:yeats2, putative [Pediculus humanus corporis]EEB12808.1 yeats2, putative [Pediculus humanus corporis]
MEDNESERQKLQKIKSIIEREIDKELTSKQNEVSEITEKIKNVLRNLELLKYVVAVSYYDQNPGQDEETDEKFQNQIHPCVKKLLPFKSNYNKSMGDVLGSHSYETRKSKKTDQCVVQSTVSNIKKEESNVNQQNNLKMPQYVPPLPNKNETIPSCNSSAGNGSKVSYRVIVGNVSKWIPPDTREDKSTHKWMVYIRNKDESKDVTKLLKKVRYFLHESYKPHDIIDVTSPFQLTRRGWGEFPIRVQLHFIHPLNKPVDIIHNLKLDMSCSGVQMLGGETVVEVSLHQNEDLNNMATNENLIKQEVITNLNWIKEEPIDEKQDVYDDSLLTNINGFKSATNGMVENLDINNDEIDVVVKKEEPEDDFTNSDVYNIKMEEMKLAINNSRKFLLDRRKAIKTVEIEHDYLSTSGNGHLSDAYLNTFSDSIIKKDKTKGNTSEEEEDSNGFGKNGYVLHPVREIFNKKNQIRLTRITMFSNKTEEDVFKTLVVNFNKLEGEGGQSKQPLKLFKHMYLVNIMQRAQDTKLNTVEPLVQWFVQKWPIITKLSRDPTYRIIHPYSCSSEEEFFNFNIGKQRSAEWYRAKGIQKILKSLKTTIPIEEEIWTTKQIMLWSRFHGYFPMRYQKETSRERKKKEIEINIKTIPPGEQVINKFVCDTAKEIGIKIKDEEILTGIKCDSVSRVISQSVASFLEELVRKSLARAWSRNRDR